MVTELVSLQLAVVGRFLFLLWRNLFPFLLKFSSYCWGHTMLINNTFKTIGRKHSYALEILSSQFFKIFMELHIHWTLGILLSFNMCWCGCLISFTFLTVLSMVMSFSPYSCTYFQFNVKKRKKSASSSQWLPLSIV